MSRITSGISVAAALLIASPASADTDYGRVGIYSITLNSHNACVASREMTVREHTGEVRSGAFAFGVFVYEGDYVGAVSMNNPGFNMTKGQAVAGTIEIDQRSHEAAFFADSRTLLTAAVRLEVIKEVAAGRELVLNTGHVRYRIPLSGTAAALRRVLFCASDLDAQFQNPLTGDRGIRARRPAGQINPLTGSSR